MTALRSSTLEREGDPPHRFAYKMLSGVPVQSHTAIVDLAPQGAVTVLTWQVDSIPKLLVPAAVWAALVQPGINNLLKGVKKKAELRAS